MANSSSAKLAALKEKAAKQVDCGGFSAHCKIWPLITSDTQHALHSMQDQELESAFDAGPSSSQQEISMKGVGTFRVNGEESDRLLRKKPSQVWQLPCLLVFLLCAEGLSCVAHTSCFGLADCSSTQSKVGLWTP